MKSPFTKEAFAEWCEKQPKRREYDWGNVAKCACAQYADAIGDRGHSNAFWREAQGIAMGGGSKDWTFGALASRLRSPSTAKAITNEETV